MKKSIRIREQKQQFGVLGYLNKVVESEQTIKEYFGVRGNLAVSGSEADDFCRLHYGLDWRYDADLELCVNTELDTTVNKNLAVDKNGERLTLTCSWLKAVPVVEAEVICQPDEHGQCPEGTIYSALLNGCVRFDPDRQSGGSKPTPRRTSATMKQKDLARSVVGIPAYPNDAAMTPQSDGKAVVPVGKKTIRLKL